MKKNQVEVLNVRWLNTDTFVPIDKMAAVIRIGIEMGFFTANAPVIDAIPLPTII